MSLHVWTWRMTSVEKDHFSINSYWASSHWNLETSPWGLEPLGLKLCLLSLVLSPVLYMRSWDGWLLSTPLTACPRNLLYHFPSPVICQDHHLSPHPAHPMLHLSQRSTVLCKITLISPPATSAIWVICQQSSCLNYLFVSNSSHQSHLPAPSPPPHPQMFCLRKVNHFWHLRYWHFHLAFSSRS